MPRWVNPLGPNGADLGAVNLPVMIGGARIDPGDLVIGDNDSLVSLTPRNLRALIAGAEAKPAHENGWTRALADGKLAVDAFGLAAAVRT
jgi:regulator of RNase E activity RraA